MNEVHVSSIGKSTGINVVSIRATVELLQDGATMPFIARYRKEATGSLDEVQISDIRDRLEGLIELDDRREAILKSLKERDLLTDELERDVNYAESMTALEDIYLPYRPKRRTRATIAREKGLEPLADLLWTQSNVDPTSEAAKFVDEAKDVNDSEEALAGARDIMAERVNEDATARDRMRVLYSTQGVIRSKVAKGKESESSKFRDYFDWDESLASAPSHRVLAMMRGESEGELSIKIAPTEDVALGIVDRLFVSNNNSAAEQVRLAAYDSYKRLLGPSIESESRNVAKLRADETAIEVFADNLKELLLAPPLGGKNVLALDPGFRTGAKLVCLDSHGALVLNDTIYPLTGARQSDEAANTVRKFVDRYNIEAIAVGNGTGGRETKAFLDSLGLGSAVQTVLVNESGASIYSASAVAREEFPDHDLTVRGAVSIGRRLMDPLAELVKIDPQSIGVGQYQHDVDQSLLKKKLDEVVTSGVNMVGVNVNTASKQLLTYVSGLGPQLAENIVKYRDEKGGFKSRKELLKVSRLGPKAYEQSAGFLRVQGKEPLDASAVHPERYAVVNQMASDLGCSVKELISDAQLRARVDLSRYVKGDVGLPTLQDIMEELARPGRDPRRQFEAFSFADGVNSMTDLKLEMVLPGIVTNVTAFGAFVDIGVHQDGLVHISQLANKFVKNPSDVVKVQQQVRVKVMDIDLDRKRISLSMKEA